MDSVPPASTVLALPERIFSEAAVTDSIPEAQLRQTRARRRWSEWCRMMLREAEDSRPTLEQLAGFMNISARTLARYLDAEGTSFRGLSLQVRTERARRLLAEGDLSVTQIAYRLGFTDVASFVRSFRAQTGRTPGSLRA